MSQITKIVLPLVIGGMFIGCTTLQVDNSTNKQTLLDSIHARDLPKTNALLATRHDASFVDKGFVRVPTCYFQAETVANEIAFRFAPRPEECYADGNFVYIDAKWAGFTQALDFIDHKDVENEWFYVIYRNRDFDEDELKKMVFSGIDPYRLAVLRLERDGDCVSVITNAKLRNHIALKIAHINSLANE